MQQPVDSGIDPATLQRFIAEKIFTLPGISNHQEVFTVLLTGSRAIGQHAPESDVDIDVLCPREAYEAVLQASYIAGLISTDKSFFCLMPDEEKAHFFGEGMANPHFSITPLDVVAQQLRDYEDVPLWIWTNAQVITDPGEQFQRMREGFRGYPPDVLIRKIKHRWLLAGYAGVDIYPHHHSSDDDLLPAITAVQTRVNELLRFFFLVEGQPFPYSKRLLRLSKMTALGREFCPLLQHAVSLALGIISPECPVWERLDEALTSILCEDISPEASRMARACEQAMITAGVDPAWVAADYDNVDELLRGELGPTP
ncbi:MAG: DUF4037 domain-containing protein [bacterium]